MRLPLVKLEHAVGPCRGKWARSGWCQGWGWDPSVQYLVSQQATHSLPSSQQVDHCLYTSTTQTQTANRRLLAYILPRRVFQIQRH